MPKSLIMTFSILLMMNSSVMAEWKDYSDDPRNPAMQPISDRPGLPQVLLIGDSISIGYTQAVRQQLEAIAYVHRIPENGASTIKGLEKIEQWLGTRQWDVIHFNWGLHDLKIGEGGARLVPLEDYERNLTNLVDRLRKTGATLIWATTTPVPQGVQGVPRDPDDPPRYNAVAARIMNQVGIRINDLYSLVLPKLGDLQIPQNVHFTPEGSVVLASQVADCIRKVLAGE